MAGALTLVFVSAIGLQAGEVASSQLVQAGPFILKNWGMEQGLPQTSPRALTQTRDGYLWVGTLNGLARFDGVRFQTFGAANTPELFSDTINVLYESRAGDLWIGTVDGGIACYRQGRFSLFSNAEGLGSITINGIREDGDGVLWVGTAGGLHRMISSNRFERVPATLVPVEVIAGLVAAEEGDIWVITLEHVRRLRHGQLAQPPIHTPKIIRCFETDKAGDLWLGYESGGVARIPAGTSTLHEERFPIHATSLHRDRNGVLWLGSSMGELWRADGQGNWSPEAKPSSSRILTIQDDAAGNLWLGLEEIGLCRLRKRVLTTHTVDEGSAGAHFTSVVEDAAGRIWAGTMGQGLFAWEGNRFVPTPVPSTAMNITSLLCDRNGSLICGTLHVHHGELYRRTANDAFVADLPFGKQCRTVFEDHEGGLWVGKWRGGVEHYESGRVTRYVPNNGLSNDRIYSIAQDRQGDIWIGTLKGLNRLAQGKITSFFREDGLGGNDVRVLFVDHAGTLWAGSSGGGLTRYRDGHFSNITTRQGLIGDWVEQILEDDDENLWLGSNAGLMRASLDELNDCASGKSSYVHCTAFRREEGLLLSNTGTGFQPSCLKARSGQLWFATEAGVVVIDPKRIRSNPKPPAVYIERFLADETAHEILQKDGAAVTVSPGTQRLEFHYTGLDLSAPAAVRFKHRLEGYDDEWLNAGTRREAVYTRVPPGHYRFQVMAANNDGVWNEGSASLAVVVAPAWWQTFWFRAAALAGLAVAMFGSYQVRVCRHKTALALQEAFSRRLIESQEQERKRVAAELHDSLGQSLQIIKGRAQLALNRVSQPAEAARQLEEISEAVTQAVREVRAISHALRPAELDQLGLTNAVEWMARQAAATSQTRFECELEKIDNLLPPEIEISLFRIAQEGISNVLRHARASEAILELKRTNGFVRFSLVDDGKGFASPDQFDPARARFGNGLAGVAERVKLMGGAFDLQSAPGRGTRLTVTCKVNHSA